MVALYADEDFDLRVVEMLRTKGWDIETVFDDGRGGQGIDDDDVLARAISLGRTIVTFNRRHFWRLHLLVPNHFGIVICTRDADNDALARRIDSTL